ncbi:MAG: hypothetical protein L6R43_14255 [Planctomycetes bacterium]|nr:hypothetical protein [Planctomycetota bacterium]
MAPALAALLLACQASGAGPPDAGLTDLDRRVAAALSATLDRAPILVHYDPAALSEGWAAREGDRALGALRLLEARLDLRWEGTAHLFLHRDEESFRAATGAPGEWAAFATGTASIHLPRGAPVVHEMTHLLAHRIPGAAGRDPGGLLREGLAAAMEGEDHGVEVLSWAAVYARLGLLPRLADLRDRWPSAPPASGPHAYHVAGAFVAWLLEVQGPAKVKEVYAAPDRAEEILGSRWEGLEEAFAARLLERPVGEGDEARVRRGLGLPADPVPEALARGRALDLLAGAPSGGWIARRPAAWSPREGGGLRGESAQDWAILETDRRFPPGTALRLRARAGPGASLLLRMHRTGEGSDEALLTPGGGLLAFRGGDGGFAATEVRLVPGRWTEILLHSVGGAARLYVDGRLVREAEGAFREAEGALGVGVRGGALEIAEAAAVEPR